VGESIELASWVTLEGCFNFRDLGGYRTAEGARLRTGRVFRSDGLQALTAADLDHLCSALGLREVIDLRSSDEVDEDGTGPIAERTRIHPVPLFQRTRSGAAQANLPRQMPESMGDLYFVMLTAARDPIVQVVRLLAGFDAPAVFHCAAGKDRTGVISSLLLSLLGVPEETIVADYAFSRQNIDRINARLNASETYQRLMSDLPEGAYDADPAAMRHFLGRVAREHGSMVRWAEEAGIDAGTRDRLRDRLLE
jgi:protein tyrosine/serine phosphatase